MSPLETSDAETAAPRLKAIMDLFHAARAKDTPDERWFASLEAWQLMAETGWHDLLPIRAAMGLGEREYIDDWVRNGVPS